MLTRRCFSLILRSRGGVVTKILDGMYRVVRRCGKHTDIPGGSFMLRGMFYNRKATPLFVVGRRGIVSNSKIKEVVFVPLKEIEYLECLLTGPCTFIPSLQKPIFHSTMKPLSDHV